MHSNWSRLKSKRRQHDCAPCARLKLEREKDVWSKNVTILKYVKERVDLNVYMCDWEVFNDVSFWLCVLNSPGVCQSFDHVSSNSLSWCCDDGGPTLTGVCSPLCPSLELSAWWKKKKRKKKRGRLRCQVRFWSSTKRSAAGADCSGHTCDWFKEIGSHHSGFSCPSLATG